MVSHTLIEVEAAEVQKSHMSVANVCMCVDLCMESGGQPQESLHLVL